MSYLDLENFTQNKLNYSLFLRGTIQVRLLANRSANQYEFNNTVLKVIVFIGKLTFKGKTET